MMNETNNNAIIEGKQRARETMAAAGIETSADATTSSANGGVQQNGGAQLSRKRSHDGTQLPVADAASRHEWLLDRMMQRDALDCSVVLEGATERSKIITEKAAERDFRQKEEFTRKEYDPGAIFGPGYRGYGNRITEGGPQAILNAKIHHPPIVYSALRGPQKGRRSRGLYISRKDGSQHAEQREELVPVRLDIELDKLRLRDTFTWNLHEKLIPQELFADYLVEDLKVPPEAMQEVSRQVKLEMAEQIQNFYPHVIVEDGPLEPGRPYSDHKDDEMRIVIKLNITIGRIALVDQFEWDINNPLNSPEEFARQMAWENALSGEFTTAIAHSIREQSQLFTKSLYLTNHCFDGRPVEDPDLRDAFLQNPIHSPFRPLQSQKDWMPFMYEMTEADMERTETSMMREHRAQKRQLNRRGGPALPDLKERPRTIRSLIVHSVIPGAVDTFETTGIPKTRRSGRGGRRPGARADGDIDSEDLETDDSGGESPAPSVVNTGTTARTRGMRGAASAAQAAMRATYSTRSETPDLQTTPHETRTASRARSTLRDDEDEDTLIVKLRIGRNRLKAFWNEYEAKQRAKLFPLAGYASQPPPPATPTPKKPSQPPRATGTPQPTNGHSRTPSTKVQSNPSTGVEIATWPAEDEKPPPPPPWLAEAVRTLRSRYPESDFEPLMRLYGVDANGGLKKMDLEPGDPPPAGVKLMYLPRLRCNDCPGKVYTATPGQVVDDFEVHLRNRSHRERVLARQAK